MSSRLSPQEQEEALACLQHGQPLPMHLLERLFPLPEHGAFFWPGKYSKEPYPAACPDLSLIQESAAAAVNNTPWQGMLWGMNNLTALSVLQTSAFQKLLQQQGGIKFIYIDPPFATENTFHVPQGQVEKTQPKNATKAPAEPIFAYSDQWEKGKAGYYSMLKPRLEKMYDLLSPDGVLCLHCDWRAGPGIRMLLDESFGPEAFVNEIIWHYTGGGRSKRYFSRKHDSLFVYAKGTQWTFNTDAIRVPYVKSSGYAQAGITSRAGKLYLPNPKGTPRDDVFNIPMLNPMSKERLAYATQKPLALLEPILQAFTQKGDVVGDFFCGSGTTLAAAARLERKFIGCDQGEQAIKVSCGRLAAMLQATAISLQTDQVQPLQPACAPLAAMPCTLTLFQ